LDVEDDGCSKLMYFWIELLVLDVIILIYDMI